MKDEKRNGCERKSTFQRQRIQSIKGHNVRLRKINIFLSLFNLRYYLHGIIIYHVFRTQYLNYTPQRLAYGQLTQTALFVVGRNGTAGSNISVIILFRLSQKSFSYSVISHTFLLPITIVGS